MDKSQLDSVFLIVDDEVTIRKLSISFLKRAGYKNFHIAEDGERALGVLKYNEVDIIIADWKMPNMDGIELLDNVRKNVQWEKIPFIMLTAEAHQENVVQANFHKATDYIVKPFTGDVLLKKVNDALKKKKVLQDAE